LNAALPPLEEFVLPGGNRAAAVCHVARTVCRRLSGVPRRGAPAPLTPRCCAIEPVLDLLPVMARRLAREAALIVLWRRREVARGLLPARDRHVALPVQGFQRAQSKVALDGLAAGRDVAVTSRSSSAQRRVRATRTARRAAGTAPGGRKSSAPRADADGGCCIVAPAVERSTCMPRGDRTTRTASACCGDRTCRDYRRSSRSTGYAAATVQEETIDPAWRAWRR
jgi:hypothetical protein